MADTSTRELLARVLDRIGSDPESWTDRDTETIIRLRAAAEWEAAVETLDTNLRLAG
ncbi:hypothetical protein GCM10010363_60180 [Streptomyces omiyaensis]|uniref:hypothetical protein n=1 Tax=Streptomyces omiyaensis TaxID=68247 RepID=UPI00167449C9|nr:hypothetical protein [Streptomyces omiyaensis]GGY71026.1 hypothetical protein GCM10010363_60180 [Streptomyces omiyaensis]